jgi:hypothetical protein
LKKAFKKDEKTKIPRNDMKFGERWGMTRILRLILVQSNTKITKRLQMLRETQIDDTEGEVGNWRGLRKRTLQLREDYEQGKHLEYKKDLGEGMETVSHENSAWGVSFPTTYFVYFSKT